MQSVSQAIEIASYITGTHRGRANQIARALIDAGVLPKSSGRDIKKIGAEKMLPLVAAIAMAEKVADAAAIAKDFEALPYEGKNDGRTLSDIFAAIMKRDGAWKSAEIEFSKQASGYAATIYGCITNDNGDEIEASFPFWRSRSWGHFSKTSFTISAEGVDVMRNLFARTDVEGMSFSLSTGAGQE
ncbi:hypothetical protein ACO2JO_00570 [Leptospira interrogans]